jgi:hypothetical protein
VSVITVGKEYNWKNVTVVVTLSHTDTASLFVWVIRRQFVRRFINDDLAGTSEEEIAAQSNYYTENRLDGFRKAKKNLRITAGSAETAECKPRALVLPH